MLHNAVQRIALLSACNNTCERSGREGPLRSAAVFRIQLLYLLLNSVAILMSSFFGHGSWKIILKLKKQELRSSSRQLPIQVPK